jgi:hypothetical protein
MGGEARVGDNGVQPPEPICGALDGRSHRLVVRGVAGAGNQKERLAIMRRHRDQVNAQIARLTECLDLINYKVGVYEDILADQCLTEGDVVESTAS